MRSLASPGYWRVDFERGGIGARSLLRRSLFVKFLRLVVNSLLVMQSKSEDIRKPGYGSGLSGSCTRQQRHRSHSAVPIVEHTKVEPHCSTGQRMVWGAALGSAQAKTDARIMRL